MIEWCEEEVMGGRQQQASKRASSEAQLKLARSEQECKLAKLASRVLVLWILAKTGTIFVALALLSLLEARPGALSSFYSLDNLDNCP